MKGLLFSFISYFDVLFRIADGECTKKTVEYENQEITANKLRVTYTYSVQWKKVDAPSNSRWDAFLLRPNPDRHHYALLNGVAIVLCTLVILLIISLKTVQKESTTDDKDLKDGFILGE